MRVLLLLVATSLVAAYDVTNQASRTTGSIPAVLAVRNGGSYSATENVVLRSQDVASILNSGNYATFQGKQGDATVTYAAIPVVRSGNSYSVAQSSLAQQQQQVPVATRTASVAYGNRVAVPATTRTETVTSTRVAPVVQIPQPAPLAPATREGLTLSVPVPNRNIGYTAGGFVNNFGQNTNGIIIDANRAQVSNAATFYTTGSNSAGNVGSSSNTVRVSNNQDYTDEIPGVAGVDYSVYAEVPRTSFTCEAQGNRYGYYADQEADCQVFHVCHDNVRSSFLCPNGTRFDQENFVCNWWYNVDCGQSARFYSLNDRFGIVPGTSNVPVSRTNSVYY